MESFKAAIEKIKKQVGDKRVICGLSGGVDSSVAAVLIHEEAIGDQLTCIYVDTGLMRSNETSEVVNIFRENFNIPLIDVNAGDIFLSRLKGIIDPEEKEKLLVLLLLI